MIDIHLARENPDAVKAALARKGVDPSDVERLLDADRRAREIGIRRDERRATVKDLSRQVGEARRTGDEARAAAASEQSRAAGEEESTLDAEAGAAQAEVRELLLWLPNLPAPEAPDGEGADDNLVVRRWPETARTYTDHQRVPHWDVGAALRILDLERGAKLSGSMFPLYRGPGARLIRALTAFALDRHAELYEEIRPPTLVRTETMVSTGHLPKFADDAYHLERDDLWAIPTAEVPLTSMFRDEILEEADLPVRLTAGTACYRREAGSAGRDTRGLLRVHEFDKVELFAYATAQQSPAEHSDMVARAEALLRELELEYRVLDLCTGELGNAAARTFDIEVYAAGCDMWLEVSSVSWCTDYQSRRANIRYRPSAGGGSAGGAGGAGRGGKPVFVHTLNGSAIAWARVWAALVENGRQPDGSVVLPSALAPYLGGRTVIDPPASSRAPALSAMDRPTISPMPAVAAGVGLPWDVSIDDPISALAEARHRHGDTFVVDSGDDRYLFTFSPVGVGSFYALPEERASKGIADWRMLRRKLPDEIFAGRRTLPHQLFGRDDVAAYLANVEGALDAAVDELGVSGEFDVFDLTRRLGHRVGLASWGGPGSADGERFDRLVQAFDALDGSDSFVHPDAMAAVAAAGKADERAALAVVTRELGLALVELPGAESDHALFARVAGAWSDEPSEERAVGVARDVALVHVASMSNLFAALGWMLIDLTSHPDELARVRDGDRARAEACALESTRMAQRSIMARYVTQPVTIATGDAVLEVGPGATIATLLPLTNTSAAPGLESWDPDRWNRRRLADPSALAAIELVTVFGHGRHTCPAQPFSLSTMTAAATRFAHALDMEPAWIGRPHPVRAQIGGVARAGEPCPVSYRRR